MFLTLADTLAEDFDLGCALGQLASVCRELLSANEVGVALTNPDGSLALSATATPTGRQEAFAFVATGGPCLETTSGAGAVAVPDLRTEGARWPQFTEGAARLGLTSAHTFPMRLRDDTIGALSVFHAVPTALSAADSRVAQSLADIATIGVLHLRRLKEREQLAEQLQTALDSRVVIEQAKGILAEVGRLDMGGAFTVLRQYARDHNHRLTAVAGAVVARELPAAVVLSHAATRTPGRRRRHVG